MSAQRLREAADAMRKNAEGLPPAPWGAMEIHIGAVFPEWVVDSDERLIAGNIGLSEDPSARPLAEHIAAWHPHVTSLTAALLDTVAMADEAMQKQLSTMGKRGHVFGYTEALTLADAYLNATASPASAGSAPSGGDQ